MNKVLNQKGKFFLLEYKSGLYCVDKITKSVGKTLFASFNRDEAFNYFNSL